MSDLLLLDVSGAVELHHHLLVAADDLDGDAAMLTTPLITATELLTGSVPDVARLQHSARELRDAAAELEDRIRLVLVGGADMNAGLAALETVRAHFTTIETHGNPDRTDGRLSREDLSWARDELDGRVSTAAKWLLDHPTFFTKVETARDNDSYLDRLADGEFHHDDGDGRLSVDDLDAFLAKAIAWSTLLPHMSTIDTAAHGGEVDGVLIRSDFEAFLSGYDLPPDVADAVRQVLDDGAYHDAGGVGFGTMLDAVSFVPVIGDIVDGGRALYYALEGDYTTAALYGLGIVPLPGLSGSGVRGAVKAVEAVTDVAITGGRRAATEQAAETAVTGTIRSVTTDAGARELLEVVGADDGWLGAANRTIAGRIGKEVLTR